MVLSTEEEEEMDRYEILMNMQGWTGDLCYLNFRGPVHKDRASPGTSRAFHTLHREMLHRL